MSSVIGLLGDSGNELAMYDERFAEHMKCSVRTVRRWRAEHIKTSREKSFSFIEIIEGEYDKANQCFKPTRYRLNSDAQAYVERVVTEARASDEYWRDRRKAIERASGAHYEDIPDAPPRRRTSKPRRSSAVQLERDFINARRNLAKGQTALAELPERSRAVFLGGAQGEELRKLLLEMRGEIDAVLLDFPQTIEDVEIKDIPATDDRYVPLGDSDVGAGDDSAATAAQGTVADETSVRAKEEEARTEDVQAEMAWSDITTRLNTPPVRAVEVEIRAGTSAENSLAVDDPPDLTIQFDDEIPINLDELAEAEGVWLEGCGELEPETMPEVANSPPEREPPLDDEEQMYRIFNDSINRRADELISTGGMTWKEAQRAAWAEHGTFYTWLERQREVSA